MCNRRVMLLVLHEVQLSVLGAEHCIGPAHMMQFWLLHLHRTHVAAAQCCVHNAGDLPDEPLDSSWYRGRSMQHSENASDADSGSQPANDIGTGG
jgi:hypothetical protein